MQTLRMIVFSLEPTPARPILQTSTYFVGSGAGVSNVGSSRNVFIGYQAGQTHNAPAEQNVFIGFQSGQFNSSAKMT